MTEAKARIKEAERALFKAHLAALNALRDEIETFARALAEGKKESQPEGTEAVLEPVEIP